MNSIRLLFAMAVMLMAATATSWSQANVNLLANGSFERRTISGRPDSWSAYGSAGTNTRVALSTYCGDYVLRVTDSSTTTAAGMESASMPVVVGGSYTAEAYIKRTDATNTQPSIYIRFYNSAGTLLSSVSKASVAAANVWDPLLLTTTAPAGAATARILCYSNSVSTGSSYFDGVSLRQNVTVPATLRYVSPNGTGSGGAASTAAKYNSATFWSGVQTLLATQSVKVVFLQGDYIIDTDAHRFILGSKGHATNRLILEGQRPFGSVFTRTNNAQLAAYNDPNLAGRLTMVNINRCQNITIRHLHWENDTTLPDKLAGYGLVIDSGPSGVEMKNVMLEGCSFVGLGEHYYGAMGFHDTMTHDGEVRLCEFVRGGYDTHFHYLYNYFHAYRLNFRNNYFEDCAGVYLRLRASCRDSLVAGNQFVATTSTYNHHFVELATFNNVNPGDEMWGYNHTIRDNSFLYAASGGNNVAIHLHHSGFDPYKTATTTWKYLLDSYYANALSGTNVYFKKSILKYNYGVHNGGTEPALVIENNARTGSHNYKVQLESRSAYGSPNLGGDGEYNISDVYPLD